MFIPKWDIYTNPIPQGSAITLEEVVKGCKSQSMRRRAVKCCLPDLAWLFVLTAVATCTRPYKIKSTRSVNIPTSSTNGTLSGFFFFFLFVFLRQSQGWASWKLLDSGGKSGWDILFISMKLLENF